MTSDELAKHGYEFRRRSTYRYGACVTLCRAGQLVDVFFASSSRLAISAARKRAIVDFTMRRLS